MTSNPYNPEIELIGSLKQLVQIQREEEEEELPQRNEKFYNIEHGLDTIMSSNLIIFDEFGQLDMMYEGSRRFVQLIEGYYKLSIYDRVILDIQNLEAHRSRMDEVILEDLRVNGFIFVKRSLFYPEKLLVLDYMISLAKIRDGMDYEQMKATRKRRRRRRKKG